MREIVLGMRVAYLSHSLVADRQAHWASSLRQKLEREGGSLLEVYPSLWGRHIRPGGWIVERQGDMVRYDFPPAAWEVMERWMPDVVLVQNEAYCRVTRHAADWCREHKARLVVFSWENMVPPDAEAVNVLNEASVTLWGNTDAFLLAESAGLKDAKMGKNAHVVPQVGINADLFQAIPGLPREYDVGFAGRANEPMKGENVLDAACAGQHWRVRKFHKEFSDYRDLPGKYRSLRVLATPSLDVPHRPREQFAPAVNIEALFCGTPLVTTSQEAIHEWLDGCPAALFASPGDPDDLRDKLKEALTPEFASRSDAGRVWALERFSNDAVANEYAAILQGMGG